MRTDSQADRRRDEAATKGKSRRKRGARARAPRRRRSALNWRQRQCIEQRRRQRAQALARQLRGEFTASKGGSGGGQPTSCTVRRSSSTALQCVVNKANAVVGAADARARLARQPQQLHNDTRH